MSTPTPVLPTTFRRPVATWFREAFQGPTEAQRGAWPEIAKGHSTLLVAPTGSGKTLAAFLVALDRLLFEAPDETRQPCRVLYISPLKALGVDVERNLRAPLAGIRAVAGRLDEALREVRVGVRSGDTPPDARRKLVRHPPDILITTPESLYLMLTSQARASLTGVELVIIDEIHAVAGTKRGAHLFASLERLEALRSSRAPLQRIGLSATQRPLDEIQRLLGGGTLDEAGAWTPRPVSLVEAKDPRELDLRVEVPTEDMATLGTIVELPSGPAAQGDVRHSVWPDVHERLVELIRAHRTTLIFVNSRRLAERLATAINDEADADIAKAHHGSLSHDKRKEVEDALKAGQLPALVATSSLELGIDMGSIDLVVNVECPPGVASALQRVGRASHHVGGVSRGVFLPKHRADLLACAAVIPEMRSGEVEATHYPRNPLDVLAQHIVAMVSTETLDADTLYARLRQAAPFADLPRESYEGVLDMLAGRFDTSALRGLRPRLEWDRATGALTPRRGAHRTAILGGGTIPDRGLYGVFLAEGVEEVEGRARPRGRRVGELDEEMVFETKAGDVILLGATAWRVEAITTDRVLVRPAPGEPGRMPFWRGPGLGRSLSFGRAIGRLTRELETEPQQADARLRGDGLDASATRNLLDYLREQQAAEVPLPTDRRIVVETFPDEIGDLRLAILSPFGRAVHAPWAAAIRHAFREAHHIDLDVIASDDGIILRLPDGIERAPEALLVPDVDSARESILHEIATLPAFAASFRESAARALLLPRRRPGERTPLWLQRRRAADLLTVAREIEDFPIVLEAYRECMADHFDLAGLTTVLEAIHTGEIEVHVAQSRRASPFAQSLLFGYAGAFVYNEDVPPAERRAAALTLDTNQLQALLGEAELRRLLDPEVVARVVERLQLRDLEIRDADELVDLLRARGALDSREIASYFTNAQDHEAWLVTLEQARRILQLRIAGEARWCAAEHAAAYRDALGAVLPAGLPSRLLEPVQDPLAALLMRYARTHGPFSAADVAATLGLAAAAVLPVLGRLERAGRLVSGTFLPDGRDREWCEPDVLRRIKRASLARLRADVQAVDESQLALLLQRWHELGVHARPRRDLMEVVWQLAGSRLPASELETSVLPARLPDYTNALLDQALGAGEAIWIATRSLGSKDIELVLMPREQLPQLAPTAGPEPEGLALRIEQHLGVHGAVFFPELRAALGGFAPELLEALWDLVLAGRVTNDSFAPVRSRLRGASDRTASRPLRMRRSRGATRPAMPGSEGRWSLVPRPASDVSEADRRLAAAETLLDRDGVLVRDAVSSLATPLSFSQLYHVLTALEERGRVRRGYFIEGRGAAQFALPGAATTLRKAREADEQRPLVLAACDPAQPYGLALPWPDEASGAARRVSGARVLLSAGRLLAWLSPRGRHLLSFVDVDEIPRLAEGLTQAAARTAPDLLLIERIDAGSALRHPMTDALVASGLRATPRGLRVPTVLDARG